MVVVLAIACTLGFIRTANAATIIDLGVANGFAVLAGSGITNTLGPTAITGDVGSYATATETGFGSVILTGTNHAGDGVTQGAKTDLATAYGVAAGEPCDVDLSGQDLGGLTLTAGVYCFSSSAQLTGTLTLNGGGDPGAVFIFKIGSTLTTASASHVSLINSAQASGVFWQVGSSATFGTTSDFKGSILALDSITDDGGSTFIGRLLASTALVTLNNTTVTVPHHPTVLSATTGDSNLNGKIDHLTVVYSEAVNDPDYNAFAVTGYTMPGTGSGSGTTTLVYNLNEGASVLDDASFNYSSGTYCQSGANPTPSITGLPGGTFSSVPAGLIINPSTGTIILSSSALGAYTVAYTTNGTNPNTSSFTATIGNTSPSATFSYLGSPFPQNGTNPLPIFGPGASAGTFSVSPGGLVFANLNSGEINLAASAPGTYLVTNSIPLSGACTGAIATTTVIVTAAAGPILFGPFDTGATPVLTWTAANAADLAGDSLNIAGAPAHATDGAAPVVISAKTGDLDADGQIDSLAVVYSEGVIDNGSGGFHGVAVSGHSINVGNSYGNNSTSLTYVISESGTPDTGATPTLTWTRSSVIDFVGNHLDTTNVPATATDGAKPILFSFTSSTSNGTYGPGTIINLTANYSETIASGSVTINLNNSVTGLTLSTLIGTSTISGNYTVGISGSPQSIAHLDVGSISTQSVSDGVNVNSTTTMPATTLYPTKSITIDTAAPVPSPATLHVVKTVMNNSGGSATSSSFNLHVTLSGTDVAGSPAIGIVSPGRSYILVAGTYVVGEDAAVGYTSAITGDCDASGNIALSPGDSKTCTITNDDIAPAPPAPATLHVIKLVINGNGSAGVPSDFMAHVKLAGTDVAGSPMVGLSAPGRLYTLVAGTYIVSENANLSYSKSFTGDCDPSGSVTLTAGIDKHCTIINTNIPAPAPIAPIASEVVSGGGGGGTSYLPRVVPLIGILKVPTPLVLPTKSGLVTYNYTVWNVGGKQALTDVTVTDDKCSPVRLISGDLNSNGKLDRNESWKYSCATTLSVTTTNTSTAIGYSNDIYHHAAIATAIATVVVGTTLPPPLINIVKVPDRLAPFPIGGGDVIYKYTVTNPGVIAMDRIVVTDDQCGPVLGPVGDTNNNNLLDPSEKWIYTCRTHVSASVRGVATVKGFANGSVALGYAFATVLVASSSSANGEQVRTIPINLGLGSRGANVKILQQFLISQDKGPAAKSLAKIGATAYFGIRTRAALAEFQAKAGIKPAIGYFNAITRAYLSANY